MNEETIKFDITKYFDNSSTTFVSKNVADAIYNSFFINGANPSSLYNLGFESENTITYAKKTIANAIGANADEIFFTSGGTEANNLAILGISDAYKKRKIKIISSQIEHHSVLDSVKFLKNNNFETVLIKPLKDGTFDLNNIIKEIDDENKIYLFSFMLINNETGAINDISKLSKLIRQKTKNAIIHCDCVAAFGKYPVSVKKLDVDLLTITAHKICGPKGVGALFIKKGTRLTPRNIGGKQQKSIRAGTEPVDLIVGFAKATEDIILNSNKNYLHCKNLKEIFIKELDNQFLINSPENSSVNIVNISTEKINSETMLHFLEQEGFYISSGSACSKGAKSHVLEAMELTKPQIETAIRISFGKDNTVQTTIQLANLIKNGVKTLVNAF